MIRFIAVILFVLLVTSKAEDCNNTVIAKCRAPVSDFGATVLPDPKDINCGFSALSGFAKARFICEVPFCKNIRYEMSYDKPVCPYGSRCSFSSETISSMKSSLTSSGYDELFALNQENTCRPDILKKSAFLAGNEHFTVDFPGALQLTLTEKERTLEEKKALKKSDGTPVYTVTTDADSVTLKSTLYVTYYIPQGLRPEDSVSTVIQAYDRIEVFKTSSHPYIVPDQWKVNDANLDVIDSHLSSSAVLQAPPTKYIDTCVPDQTPFGEWEDFEVKSLQHPNYVQISNSSSFEKEYKGTYTFNCKQSVCKTDGCKYEGDVKFGIFVNVNGAQDANITSDVSSITCYTYSGDKASPFARPVPSWSIARASLLCIPEKVSSDFKITINKLQFCREDSTDPCNIVVRNDKVTDNKLIQDADFRFFSTDDIKPFRPDTVNNFGFDFEYELTRKTGIHRWRVVIDLYFNEIEKRPVVTVIGGSTLAPSHHGQMNFAVAALDEPKDPKSTPIWIYIVSGVGSAVGFAGIAVAAVVVVVVFIKRRRGYQTVE